MLFRSRRRNGPWTIGRAPNPKSHTIPHTVTRRLFVFSIHPARRRRPWHVRLSRRVRGAARSLPQAISGLRLNGLTVPNHASNNRRDAIRIIGHASETDDQLRTIADTLTQCSRQDHQCPSFPIGSYGHNLPRRTRERSCRIGP